MNKNLNYLTNIIKIALSKMGSYRKLCTNLDNKISPSAIIKTLKWIEYGRPDKVENLIVKLIRLLGYKVEVKVTMYIRNKDGRLYKKVEYERVKEDEEA